MHIEVCQCMLLLYYETGYKCRWLGPTEYVESSIMSEEVAAVYEKVNCNQWCSWS